jgi:hypothetical protein
VNSHDPVEIGDCYIVDFKRVNLGDAFAKDSLTTDSTLVKENEVDTTDMWAGIADSGDEGETGSLLHPGYSVGVATLAVQMGADCKKPGKIKFCPKVMAPVDSGPLLGGPYTLKYIHVLCALPHGTDGRLFYVYRMSIRKASARTQSRYFRKNNIDGDCFVMASLPGTEHGSPIVLPRVLSASDVRLSGGRWEQRPVLVEALLQAHEFERDLEDMAAGVEGVEAQFRGLSVSGLWNWISSVNTKGKKASKDIARLVDAVLDFMDIDDKRESARERRYLSALAKSSETGALEVDFVQQGNGILMDAAGVPPYFTFVESSKTPEHKAVRVALWTNQLRAWMLSGYVRHLQPFFETVVSCNTMRPSPQTLEGKCRVQVPSRFLMSLGITELRTLYNILFSPYNVAADVRAAAGEKQATSAVLNGAPLKDAMAYLRPIDEEEALSLGTSTRREKDWALHLRDLLFALFSITAGTADLSVLSEFEQYSDPTQVLYTRPVGVPYFGFYVFQAKTIIDRVFANGDLFMLSMARPLHATELELLAQTHTNTRCFWWSAFSRVSVIATDMDGRVDELDDSVIGDMKRDLFPTNTIEDLGERLDEHLLTARVADVVHSTPLAASAVHGLIIARHGAEEDSLAAPSALYLTQARGKLLASGVCRVFGATEMMDEHEMVRAMAFAVPICTQVMDKPAPRLGAEMHARLSMGWATLPLDFSGAQPPIAFGEKCPLVARRLPPLHYRDAANTTSVLTVEALRSMYLPPERALKALEFGTNGSTGVYASAAAADMLANFSTVFNGSWRSVGNLMGGGKRFWEAINWLIYTGAVVAVASTPVDYESSVLNFNPPVSEFANMWKCDADLGPTHPGAFNYKAVDVQTVPIVKPPAPVVAPIPAKTPAPSASSPVPSSSGVSFDFEDSDSDEEVNLVDLFKGVRDEGDSRAVAQKEQESAEPMALVTASGEVSDADPILASAMVAHRSRCIAAMMEKIELRARRLESGIPNHAKLRANLLSKNGKFPKDSATDALMRKRERAKEFMIATRVSSVEGWGELVRRRDLEFEMLLSEEQKHALNEMVWEDGPAIRILVGPAGVGKTALMAASAMSFGIVDLGRVVFFANMNVNVKAWQRELGPDGVVFTIASYLRQRGKIMTKRLAAFERDRVDRFKNNRFDDVGGRGEYEKKMGDVPVGIINPGDVRVVCVEEAGNIPDELMRLFLTAIYEDFPGLVRVVFFGDPDQLPPIGAGAPFWAMTRDHERRGLLMKLTVVFHTRVPNLLHTALMVTKGAMSPQHVELVRSGFKASGDGITKNISTDPANFTMEPRFHFDETHGLRCRALNHEATYQTKEIRNEVVSLVRDTLLELHSENVLILAFRHQEVKAAIEGARLLRTGIGSAVLPGGVLPSVVSGDTVMPTRRVLQGEMPKNTLCIAVGFAGVPGQYIRNSTRPVPGDGLNYDPRHSYSGFTKQAAHQVEKGSLRAILVVQRDEYFAAMKELVARISNMRIPPASVLPNTDLSDKEKYAKGEFVLDYADFRNLMKWPSESQPFLHIGKKRFGTAKLHAVVYDSEHWKLGYATTAAASQGSRAPHVMIVIMRPSRFFTWPLLNVMITRAMYTVTVVAAWGGETGVGEFLSAVVKQRNIVRTNLLPSFFGITFADIEAEDTGSPLSLLEDDNGGEGSSSSIASSHHPRPLPAPEEERPFKKPRPLQIAASNTSFAQSSPPPPSPSSPPPSSQ